MKEITVDNKITFFGKVDGVSVEQLIRYQKFDMKVKHFHSQYEFFYIIEGKRQFFFNNKSYNAYAGDLAIIDTNLVHTTRTVDEDDKGYNRVILYIDYEQMCEFDKLYPGLNLVDFFHKNYGIYHFNDEQKANFLNLYRDLRHEFTKKKKGYKDRIYIYLLSWLARFSQSYGNNENIAAPRDDQRAQTVSKISSYLEKNYTEQILLEEISDKLYLSKYYLCRIFKEYTGFTITEYVNILRIKKATDLLENSDKSILEIADLLGFESMTYFERVFKKFMNITPLKYKKSHHSVTYGQKELNTIDDSDYI